ncbi:hypothetical protein [Streptomyces stelliscabiei]|uniref:hypothetical protein n=1 Tax=Streptomyces stelliscabiei TaxID=146820 RepID=UPI003EBB8EA5
MTPDWPPRTPTPSWTSNASGHKSVLGNALPLGLAFYALALLLIVVDHLRPDPVHPRRGRP